MTRARFWLLLLALALLSACYLVTEYHPAECAGERVDTVAVLLVGSSTHVVTEHTCTTWRAITDTTKCWDRAADPVPCPAATRD